MEQGGRIKTEAPGPRKGGFVDERAGGIAGCAAAPVRAVGVGRQRRDAFGSLQCETEGEGVFLVGAAAALAADGDGEFAARDKGDAPARCGDLEGAARAGLGDLARFALDIGPEHHGLVAGPFGLLGGSRHRVAWAGDNAVFRAFE
jgi:hypothetical protein